MTDKKKLKLLHLSQPQRACLEGLSNRRPQLPTDPIRDELVALGLVTQQGARWTLTPTGRKVLAAGSNRRNSGGFSVRSEEHTSELQSLMRISYAVFCLKKKKTNIKRTTTP